jgi:exodeoxyribonuclease V alpha subunit
MLTVPSDEQQVEAVQATVVHVLFANDDSGWSAVRCRSDSGKQFTAVGTLLGVREDDDLRLTGSWVHHPKFGKQLQVKTFAHVDPTTLDGLRRFLGSGRVRGLGKTMAARVVDHFGLDTVEVLEHQPQRLREVRGIGVKTASKIEAAWRQHRESQQTMVFLTGHGVSPALAARVWKRYAAGTLQAVRTNPYRLAEEVRGIGFLTADRIARSIGIPADAPERHEAGLLHALRTGSDEGHTFLPRDELQVRAGDLLEVPASDLEPGVHRLAGRDAVVIAGPPPDPAVYLPHLEEAERTTADRLRRLLRVRRRLKIHVQRAVEWYQSRSGIVLAGQQRAALEAALTHPVTVITGGPGTGKTTLVRGLTTILGRKGLQVRLCSPTGRAAKRLQEATGKPAKTIHRLLEFDPAGAAFSRHRDRPLKADAVVVDEVSMLDIELACHLVSAVPDGCRLVLVGDADQLPSVGPGAVLAELIASGAVPVIRLEQIFRQAARSLIVDNAHRINRGELPVLRDGEQDFYFIRRDDPEAAARTVVAMATERIPARFRLDPIDDVQVLVPMHRGELGVQSLNLELQHLLVPGGDELEVGSRRYRVGDKVMQVRNNYDLDVFNGDIGRVRSVDAEERALVVVFDGRHVTVAEDDLEDLVPAYACTIHKSQGSEYPAVVIGLHTQHYVMLQRNLLYTAITRGRRLVVVVGSRAALERAVRNSTVRHRHSLLAHRLRSGGALGVAR